MIADEVERLRHTTVSLSAENNAVLESLGSAPIASGAPLDALLRRPELNYDLTAPLDPARPDLPRAVREGAWIEIKYEGYIKRQLAEAKALQEIRASAAACGYRLSLGARTAPRGSGKAR